MKWGLVFFGLPLAARVLHEAADLLEERQGATPAVRNLRRAGSAAESVQDRLRGRRRGSAGTGRSSGPWD